MDDLQLIANTAFGLEAITARELRDLGYEDTTIEDGRVRFRGDLAAICRTNLWLRSAERVQIFVGEFPATDFGQLFDRTKALPWEQWLDVDASFPVIGRSVKSTLQSVPACQRIVKKAIVERLKKTSMRAWFAETGPERRIEVSLLRDRVTLSIDTTGAGLHKRGYRRLVGAAPLRETLAASLILLSFWNRDRLLVDPFCGTGTIAIEAAQIARNLAPGRNREFIAERWPQIPTKLWNEARREAREVQKGPLALPIIGTDIDPSAIKLSRQHAQEAGVRDDIHFEVRRFDEINGTRDYGIVITNPPYGARLGTSEELKKLYSEMGELLLSFDTWSHYILTSFPLFERIFGKPADRRRKLYNGRIECTLYQYQGPRPPRETEDNDEASASTPQNEPGSQAD